MANDWISVNDRLPEPDRVVLVIVSGKPCENITLENALELAWWYESGGWVLETWPEWDGAEVTHWMPAPSGAIWNEERAIMRIIYKAPSNAPEVREVDNTLKALQDCVGGYIETVTFASDVVIICNEEGRLLGLQPNPVMGGNFVGPVLLVGVKGDEFTDLTDRQVNTLMRYIEWFEEEYPCET